MLELDLCYNFIIKLLSLISHLRRESVIDINNRALSDNRLDVMDISCTRDPDYKNLQYNQDGSLTFDPAEGGGDGGVASGAPPPTAASSFNDQIKILGNIVAGTAVPRRYENTRMPNVGAGPVPDHVDEDYINDYPEGLEHTYSNQDDLLLQVRQCVHVRWNLRIRDPEPLNKGHFCTPNSFLTSEERTAFQQRTKWLLSKCKTSYRGPSEKETTSQQRTLFWTPFL